ncbi:e3 ubiquitin-protein ligase ari5-related [Anaeramoeba flamelloides]|uniref:RBR-type E3 ubiquitin transferase n=1 Tax=Anaeramoeba flamelloides TaxID=1746091 RepID=A0AAV7YZQ8_9EUKA|nr:e3 ubiquitin-protein ligase ari5-related [Anaeramoeba flamelloides]
MTLVQIPIVDEPIDKPIELNIQKLLKLPMEKKEQENEKGDETEIDNDLDDLYIWPKIVEIIREKKTEKYFLAYIHDIEALCEELNLDFEIGEILVDYYNGDFEKIKINWTRMKRATMKETKINQMFFQERKKDYYGKHRKCTICYTQQRGKKRHSLGCRHFFCKKCWNEYVNSSTQQGKVGCIGCMSYKCSRRASDRFLLKVVTNKVFYNYKLRLVKQYISNSNKFCLCPSPSCGQLCSLDANIVFGSDALCACGHRFCFKCHGECHSPLSCEQVQRWEKDNNFNSATKEWILQHTKPCPKCNNLIEKNGGCNHMTCRKEGNGCGYEFCWVCLKEWKEHGSNWYECKFFDEKLHNKNRKDNSEQALESLMGPLKIFNKYNDFLKKIKNLISENNKQESLKKSTITKSTTKIIEIKTDSSTLSSSTTKTTTTKTIKTITTSIDKPVFSIQFPALKEIALDTLLVSYSLLKWNSIYLFNVIDKSQKSYSNLKESEQALEEISLTLFDLIQTEELSKKMLEIWDISFSLKSQITDFYQQFK